MWGAVRKVGSCIGGMFLVRLRTTRHRSLGIAIPFLHLGNQRVYLPSLDRWWSGRSLGVVGLSSLDRLRGGRRRLDRDA